MLKTHPLKNAQKFILYAAWLTLATMTAMLLASSVHAADQTFTVNVIADESDANPGDDVCETANVGECTLRAAIQEANANGNPSDMDVINFAISGSGPHIITPNSELPIVSEKLNINGFSQSGAQPNTAASPNPMNSTIKIAIYGANVGDHHGLEVTADESEIRGLSVYGFGHSSNYNVRILGSNVLFQGNYVGVKADGLTFGDGDNSVGLAVDSTGSTTGVLVGGEDPEDRNVLAGVSNQHANSGALGIGAEDTMVYGNFIGIGKDGVTDMSPAAADANGISGPYSFGIQVTGDYGGTVIGGSTSSKRNVIAGGTTNVLLNSPEITLQGNYIGSDYTGEANSNITNGIGVSATQTTNSIIGGINPGEGNVIAGTRAAGIFLAEFTIDQYSLTLTPNNVAILGNSISNVGVFNLASLGDTNLGIDISSMVDNSNPADFLPDTFSNRGPNTNDVGDGDAGPNGMINRPVLKSAQQIGNQLTINYDLDVTGSDSDYRVEFFANDESTIFGTGPGQTYLGAEASTTSGEGKSVTLTVADNVTMKALSATVTAKETDSSSGFGATSEMSQNLSIGSESDLDADGITSATEDAAPNNGDGNNDGIADRLQATVTSFQLANSEVYETFVTDGCSENATVSSIDAASLAARDSTYTYPFGLTDFRLNCSRGNTVNVTKYVFVEDVPATFVLRKYDKNNQSYRDIPGSTITSELVGSVRALKTTYSITDGGEYDDDGVANGIIVDPVGLATQSGGNLAQTGIKVVPPVLLAILFVGSFAYVYRDYRRHKRPLSLENPNNKYTFTHHIRVVTIPLIRYRLQLKLTKMPVKKTPSSTQEMKLEKTKTKKK